MPFAATDYNKLKTSFVDIVGVYLRRDNVASVSDVKNEERGHQIRFIQHIIAELDKKLETPVAHGKTRATAELSQTTAAEILYAALHIISTDLTSTVRTSLLLDGLNAVLGSVEMASPTAEGAHPTEQPVSVITAQQRWMSYKQFNAFVLGTLYKDRTPDKGYDPANPIQGYTADAPKEATPLGHLTAYVLSGLDAEYHSLLAFTDNLKPEDATAFESDSVIKRKTSESAKNVTPFQERTPEESYKSVKAHIATLFQKERAAQSVAECSNLQNIGRRNQMLFLQAALTSVDESALNVNDKTTLLAALMHVIRMQINIEYRYDMLHPEALTAGYIQKGSLVQTLLTDLLMPRSAPSTTSPTETLAPRTIPSSATMEYMCALARNYVMAVLLDPAHQRKYSFPDSTYIKSVVTTAQTAVTLCRKATFNEVMKTHANRTSAEAALARFNARDARTGVGVLTGAVSHLFLGGSARAQQTTTAPAEADGFKP